MRLAGIALCLGVGAATAESAQDPAMDAHAGAARAALAVMDAFMAAFNARDEAAWADTLHFPHVRIASHQVSVFPDRAAFLGSRDLDAFAAATGWDHSAWDSLQIVQSSAEKVHIAVTFTRYDAAGQVLASYDSLYVVEKLDGRWGIRARSSFAP